ncbi:hypothetical protein NDU88_005093 [Pleurodeles waltl]|uniref:Uncharacterized protein n=1 Tax=Pleurodeles waltl TaxID=8319 RepID=A0AAV7QGV2_PLEWA|nr:hypothetical protein NDU88_005093 [Pleurodeles waltl]
MKTVRPTSIIKKEENKCKALPQLLPTEKIIMGWVIVLQFTENAEEKVATASASRDMHKSSMAAKSTDPIAWLRQKPAWAAFIRLRYPRSQKVHFDGGNGLAAASEGEIDLPLYAPGSQSNVGLAQEVVSEAGYCEQVAAAVCLFPSTDSSTPACTLEAIRDYRQGRVDLLAQGEVGEIFFSLSDQSQDSDEDSTCPSIDSETCDSSTAPLTPISVLRGTTVKRQSKQTEVTRLDKAGESSEKRGKKKKKVSRTRAMSWDYTKTQQLLHSMGDLSVAPAQTEVNVLNIETAPPSPSLHLIYQTITSQHKQTQRDSKKARVATKQLQVAISMVAKTCSEIGERIVAIECRADALESDLGAVTKQAAMHESQLSDIQWKVEDFENRQRRNNLRLIGIQEVSCESRQSFERARKASKSPERGGPERPEGESVLRGPGELMESSGEEWGNHKRASAGTETTPVTFKVGL